MAAEQFACDRQNHALNTTQYAGDAEYTEATRNVRKPRRQLRGRYPDDVSLGEGTRRLEGSFVSDSRPPSIAPTLSSTDTMQNPPPTSSCTTYCDKLSTCGDVEPFSDKALGPFADPEDSYVFTKQECLLQEFLNQLEDQERQNTELYLEDGKSINPILAPFLDTGRQSQSSKPFWTWSIPMQRWYHIDSENNTVILCPRSESFS